MRGPLRAVLRTLRYFSFTEILILSLSFLLTCCFTSYAVDWALLNRRTSLQSILTRMSPYMTPVTSKPETEKYYGVWRYHDFREDFYREPRGPDVIPSIPIIYVHGNAGCFRDMRSMGRFIGKYNVKLRKQRAKDFADNVRQKLFMLYKRDGLPIPVDGEAIPQSLQREAEELVIAETPILSTEMFGVDFLEESNTHSGLLLVKEARFLNYTVHALRDKLLQHYRSGVSIDMAEKEYLHSICHGAYASAACATARAQTERYSTTQRVHAELARVRRDGLWIWTESLGGIVALYAALMAPELYAGLVMAGSPLRYPPLLFDMGCVQFHRAVHDAGVAFPSPPLLSPENKSIDWFSVFETGLDAREMLRRVGDVPPRAIAERIARVALLNIHGGGLEDIVPPMSSFLSRSSAPPHSSPTRPPELRASRARASRRDVCTEELRDCGLSLTHRGLVYAEQLLDTAAESLVRVALPPGAAALLGPEHSIPYGAQRVFPTVVESLPKSTESWRREEFFFVRSLRAAGTGAFRLENASVAVAASTVEMCADAEAEVNLQEIPRDADDEADSWGPLHIFVGSTSLRPCEVHLPELRLVARGGAVLADAVESRAATRLHLPTRRKDSAAEEGRVLRTAVSFAVRARGERPKSPIWLRPRFCLRVDRAAVNSAAHVIFMQHDRIDPLANDTAERSGEISVERHGRFALIRNIDSMLMETQLAVHVENASVFPHVICGSLRSFRLALRGIDNLEVDEPESQMQYFYGPYKKGLRDFEYSWRPFHTTPFNLTNLYVVYVLSAERRPEVTLHDLALYQSPQWDSFEYWVWRFERWGMRWMAVLATYSIAGRFAGCYALLFFTLYALFGARQYLGSKKFFQNAFYRRVSAFGPLCLVLIVGVSLECITGFLAERALKVCLMDDPPLLSEEEMTGMMGVVEKLAMIFLYALPPRYTECRYSWIRLQTVLPRDILFEHLMHLGSGFCVAVILFVIEFMAFYILGIISRCLRNIVDKIFARRTKFSSILWLVALWIIPVLLYFFVPYLHVSVTTTIACILAYCAIWQIPRKINSDLGPNYRWLCFWITMVVHFLSHFEGLILVVRNYIIVTRDVLADYERFDVLPEHQAAFLVTQLSLGVVYTTVFLTKMNEANLKLYGDCKRTDKESSTSGENNVIYVLGSLCENHPRLRRALCVCYRLLMAVSLWVCAVSLRRPLEGVFPLVGICVLASYLSVRLIALW